MSRRVGGASGVFRTFTGVLGEFSRGLFSIQGAIGGLAIGAVFADIASTITDFNAAMADLSAITGATGADLEYLRQSAKDFGATTTLSASQAAEAFKLIASAKPDLLSNVEALQMVTKETIALAEAAGVELPQAASTLGQALNQFSAGAEEAARFVNVLAAGAKFGASEIPATAAALINAGTASKAAGLSFEETVTAIQLLAKTGITAEQAGTKLSTIFTRLQVQSNREFNPAIVGISEALKNLRDANLSTAEAAELFGQFSINAGRAIIEQADAFDPLREQLTGTATAYEQAGVKANTLDGDLKTLGSTAEALRIAIGERLEPSFRSAVQSLTAFIRAVTESLDGIGTFIDQMVKLGAALAIGVAVTKATSAVLALHAAFAGIGAILPLVVLGLKGMIPVTIGLGAAIKGVMAVTIPWTAVLGGVAAAVSYVALNWKDWTDALKDGESAISKVKGLTNGLSVELGNLSALSDDAVDDAYDRAKAALAEAAAVRENIQARQEEARTFGSMAAQRTKYLLGMAESDNAVNQALREQDDAMRTQQQALEGQIAALRKERDARAASKKETEKQSNALKENIELTEEQKKVIEDAARARANAVDQLKSMTVSLQEQIVATRDGRIAAVEFSLEHGRMAETLAAAGNGAAQYKEQIIALNRELARVQAEQDFADPSSRYRDRIKELNSLGLSQEAYNQAAFEAQEALFRETEARSRLTAEQQAQLGLLSSELNLKKAVFGANRDSGLMTLSEEYRQHNDIVKQQISLLEDEIKLVRARPASYSNSQHITQLQAQIESLRGSYKTLGDDIRRTFQDSMENSVASILRGTASIKDAFQNMADAVLDQLARIFAQEISAGITGTLMPATGGGGSGSILGGIFTSLGSALFGALERGGPAISNRPYIVGESGPEVFVPGTSGTVVSNSDVGVGGVVLNMNISTPDAQSFHASRDMIARDYATAIQKAQRFR